MAELKRESLESRLMIRVEKIWEQTKDVQPGNFDELVQGFCKEPFPEKEIAIWELITRMFVKYAEGKTQEERDELFSFFMERTMSPFIGEYKTISPERCRELDEEMKAAWEQPWVEEDYPTEGSKVH